MEMDQKKQDAGETPKPENRYINNQQDELEPLTGAVKQVEEIVLKDEDNKIFWLELVAMFVFIFGSTCFKPNTGLDLQFFVSIFMAISICARQTGAHLNPSVSVGSYLNYGGTMSLGICWIYIKAQVWGAVASITLALILNDVYRSPIAPIGLDSNEYLQLMASQAIGTFILLIFVLWICSQHNYIDNTAAKYFYVATFVYIGRKFATISTSQINIALTFARALIGIPYCDFSGLHFIFIWIIGDLIGILLAIIIFGGLASPTLQYLKQRKMKNKVQVKQRISSSVNERGGTEGYEIQMNDIKH